MLINRILSVITLTSTAYLFTNWWYTAHHPDKKKRNRIVCMNTSINQHIQKFCAKLERSYQAPWWCRNAHIQILLTFLIPQSNFEFTREFIHMSDGAIIALDWGRHHDVSDTAPIIIVCHGLTGCSKDMRSFCATAGAQGYRTVVFNKRGHGGVSLATPRLQPFGEIDDFDHAVRHITKTYPHARTFAVGFSAGAGLVVSYLGAKSDQSLVEAAVAISPGYDSYELFAGNHIMPMYNRLMSYAVKSLLKRHQTSLQQVIDFTQLEKANSLKEIDELAYMRFHGSDTLEDYWVQNNPMREIEKVSVPVLCISALDDPVCTARMIPYDLFTSHPNVMLATTEYGSHCGFFTQNGHSWAHTAAVEYLQALLHFNQPAYA